MNSPQAKLNRVTLRRDMRCNLKPAARRIATCTFWAAIIALALIVTEISGEVIAGIWGP